MSQDFYEHYQVNGEERLLIKDPDTARTLATAEEELGKLAAKKLEAALLKQHTDASNIEIVITPEDLAKRVTRKTIHAKLPEVVYMGGQRLKCAEEYTRYGKDYMDWHDPVPREAREPTLKFHGVVDMAITGNADDEFARDEQLLNKQVLAIIPSDKPGYSYLDLIFSQDTHQISSRGNYNSAKAFIELPNEDINLLIKTVEADPDYFEKFFQQVFPDLDSKNDSPGLRRLPSDGFYILHHEQVQELINESEKIRYPSQFRKFLEEHKSPLCKYKNGPYGTGTLSKR